MSVSAFIRSHRHLLQPAKEARILIAVKHAYQISLCEKGQVKHTLPIALGQDGRRRKTTDGDNRTPVGEYRITQKARGPFDGDYGAYLGAAWSASSDRYRSGRGHRHSWLDQRLARRQTPSHLGLLEPAKGRPAPSSRLGEQGDTSFDFAVMDLPPLMLRIPSAQLRLHRRIALAPEATDVSRRLNRPLRG